VKANDSEYAGMTVRGCVSDKCWLPGDWSSGMTRAFTDEELLVWRHRCSDRRLDARQEFRRDQRPRFYVTLQGVA